MVERGMKYEGKVCKYDGTTTKYTSTDKCIACQLRYNKENAERHSLAMTPMRAAGQPTEQQRRASLDLSKGIPPPAQRLSALAAATLGGFLRAPRHPDALPVPSHLLRGWVIAGDVQHSATVGEGSDLMVGVTSE